MKRCAKCGNENSDEMRFCLQCGNTLLDTPIVVNIGDSAQNRPDLKTDDFGQSVNTQVRSGGGGNQYTPPNYIPPPSRSGRGSNTKIFLAVGGVVALLLLLFLGVAAIVVYNVMNQEETVYNKATPTPEPGPTKTTKESPSPEESATPETSPTRTSKTPTLPEEESSEYSDITVKYDNTDVDYNVKDDGQIGMRMKVNFTVSGMKDKDGYLAIHFQKRDGTPLPAKKGDYRDVNGNLAAFQTLKPNYDDTEYNDLELFLPYDEFDLPVGRHNLKMDIDLLDGKGVLIRHLGFNDFWYEQK